jgi:hypothetical protein
MTVTRIVVASATLTTFAEFRTSRAATTPGGDSNFASGEHSFAAGFRARANHKGAFVWADSADADFASAGENQFLIRASGGLRLITALFILGHG